MITDDQLKGEIIPFKYEFSFDKGWFPYKFHSLQVIMPNFWYILGGFCKQRVYI
jgi:hypothetical protein